MPLGKRSLLTWDDEGRGMMQSANDHLKPYFWNNVQTTILNPIFGIMRSSLENIVSTHHVLYGRHSGKRWRQTDGFWSPMGKRRRSDEGKRK